VRRRRVIASLLVAAALGIATGLFVHGCRQDIETRTWVSQ
jgi:cytochrome c-type biogenesis protein CcmE